MLLVINFVAKQACLVLWLREGEGEGEGEDEGEGEVAQLCPTLCDPMDCSLPGSSVHGIFQALVLEWIAISFSKGSSQPRDRTRVSRIVDRCFNIASSLKLHV